MKIRKGKKVIEVSTKAYRVVYKAAGYVPVEQDEKKREPEPQKKAVELNDMKVDELKVMATERGIQGAESLKKEELLEVLKDVE